MNQASALVVRLWHEHTTHAFVPPLLHSCSKELCRLEATPFLLYDAAALPPPYVEVTAAAAEPAFEGWVAPPSLQRRRFHVCVPGLCATAPHAEALPPLHRDDMLWMCIETGVAHRCSGQCTWRGENNDTTEYVCALTGYVSPAPMLRNDYWKPHTTPWQGDMASSAAVISVPGWRDHNVERRLSSSMFIIFSATSSQQIAAFLADRHRSAAHQSRREDYLVLAAAKIAMLFTQERLLKARQAARRVEAQVRSVLESYVEIMQQSGQRLAFSDAMRLATIVRNRAHHGGLVVRSIPEEARRALITDWARRCVCFWVILSRYTRLCSGGEMAPPTFLNFVDAAIHLFADGIVVPTLPTSTVLLYPEPLVHMYAVYTPAASGDSLTRLKTRIQRCIVDAVLRDHVLPSHLRLESISFEQCLDDYLTPLTRARAPPPPKRKSATEEADAAAAAAAVPPPPVCEEDD